MSIQSINPSAAPRRPVPFTWRQSVKAALSFIEMSIVLGVLAVGMTLGVNHYTQYINHQTTQAAADQLERLTDVVSKYVIDHKTDLATQAQASGAPGLFLTTITEAELKDKDYLEDAESLVNPFGQTYQILVKGSATSATDQKIMPFIVSDGAATMIEQGDARKIATAIGGTAGYTTTAEPETIVGTNSLWSFDVSVWGLSPEPERIASAVFYNDGVEQVDVSGLLHRKNEGDPVLNTMETDILMGGNDILGAQLVQSQGLETQGLQVELANGTVATTITAGNIATTGNVQAGQKIISGGNLKAGQYVEIDGVVTEGASCAGQPAGTIARNAAGLLLSCQSGVWRRSVRLTGDTMTGRLQTQTNDWSIVTLDSSGIGNHAPQSAPGSIHINDAYIRSIGKWASQLNQSANRGVPLYMGIVQGCNAATVTTNPSHENCATQFIGYAVW